MKKPVKGLLRQTLQNDPHGDTTALQMNPQEANMVAGLLKQMGGAGVRNPKTGLLQFYEDAGGEGGHGGPVGQGGHNDIGHNGGGGNGGGSNSSGGGWATGTTVGGMPNPNPYGANSPTGKALAAQGANVNAALQSQHDYVNASQAFANRSFGDKLLGALAGMIPGIGTQKPTLGQPNSYAGGTYHNIGNPAGAIGGALGIASGIPGLGTLGEQAFGRAYNAFGGNNYSFGGPGVDPQTGQSTGSSWSGGNAIGFGGQNSPANVNPPGMGANSNPVANAINQNQTGQQAALAASTGQAGSVGSTPAGLGLLGMQQAPQSGMVAPGYGYSLPGYGYLAWR